MFKPDTEFFVLVFLNIWCNKYKSFQMSELINESLVAASNLIADFYKWK